MGEKKMKLEAPDVSDDVYVGFAKIVSLDNAQQVTVDSEKLAKLLKLITQLRTLGFSVVTITVEKGNPIVIGGKTMGIALATTISEE
jgi:hypothetical protein